MPEARLLPVGHNCTWGTIIVISVSGGIALARVIRMDKIGAEVACKSCKLQICKDKQDLTVELCWMVPPEQDTLPLPQGGVRFVSSGCCMSAKGKQVLVVNPAMLSDERGCITAVMSREDVETCAIHGNFARADSFATRAHGSFSAPEMQALIDAHEGDEAITCCRCGKGWCQDTTGPLHLCHGTCVRHFHVACLPSDTVLDDAWQCGLCTGEDDAICEVCRFEWYDNRRIIEQAGHEISNPYYTGFLLQCEEATCVRWYHQNCHEPSIGDEFVEVEIGNNSTKKGRKGNKKGKKWYCQACKPKVGAAALLPSGDASKKHKRVRIVSSSTMEDSEPMTHDWACSKCSISMLLGEDNCTCPGCRRRVCGTGGCGMPRRIVGIDITAEGATRAKRKRGNANPIASGMVSWDKVSTAEHRSNNAKITETFHAPKITPPPIMHHNVPVIDAPSHQMPPPKCTSEEVTLTTHWMCSKCAVTMGPKEHVCMCPGCSACGARCQMPRDLVGLDVQEAGAPRSRRRQSKLNP